MSMLAQLVGISFILLACSFVGILHGEYHGSELDDDYVPVGLVDQYPNRDCMKGNLTGPLNATRSNCYKLCLEVLGCVSFEFYSGRYDNRTQQCYLKTKTCKLEQLTVAVGGDYHVLRAEKIKAKLFKQRDCYGSNLGHTILIFTKRSQCYNLCKTINGCKSFTFDLTSGQCFVKNAVCKSKEMRTVGYQEYYVM